MVEDVEDVVDVVDVVDVEDVEDVEEVGVEASDHLNDVQVHHKWQA